MNRFAGDLLDGRLDRLNPSFGPIIQARAIGTSEGHYGSVSLSKRFARNWSARGIYTFGKTTDYQSFDGTNVGGTILFNADNPQGNHGRADFDARHRLTIDGVWYLPDPWKKGLLSQILGGWQMGAIGIFQSGTPFTVLSTQAFNLGGDFNADGVNFDPPNTPAFGNRLKGKSRRDFLSGLFTRADFPVPAPGATGNLGRNTFDNPGYANVDLNLTKSFRILWFTREGARFELRGEFFNLFNRVNLGGVDTTLSSLTFGKSTSSFSPRSVQVAGRIQF